LFSTTTSDGIDLLTCDAIRVRHGFTSRMGGFGARDRMTPDHEALRSALGFESIASMNQVHGRTVRVAAAPGRATECDGVVTDAPGLGLVVHTADCVPLLMWAPDVDAVAAVHAGWRGTLEEVAAAAVDTLVRDKRHDPETLRVAIGPSIRACCFEVGDEVVDAFVDAGREKEVISRPGPRRRRHVDLVSDNRRQLLRMGVPAEQIYDCGRCTACEGARFYSYRREGKGVGRLMGAIGVPIQAGACSSET